jgi:hypothetical protein
MVASARRTSSSLPSNFETDSTVADDDSTPGVGGEKVVLWLFAILALGVIVAFIFFYPSTRPEDRDFIVPAVLRDLYIPVVAWGLLTAIDAWRRQRSGWWIYMICAPVPLLNIALSVQWLRRWRKSPKQLGKWQI